MPRALEPGGRYPIVLDIDRDKPDGKRPTTWSRHLSGRDYRTLAEFEPARASHSAVFESCCDAIFPYLTGWDCMIDPTSGDEIPFSRENMDLVYSIDDLYELLGKMLIGEMVSGADLGNSESPSSSDMGGSASDVPQGDAQTARRSSSQSSSSAPPAEEQDAPPAEELARSN